MNGKMASVIEPDGSGRVVIPKKVRDELGITSETQLLLTSNQKGQIIIQKLDIEEITKRLEEELAETQVKQLAQEIRDEINEKARQALPDTA
ncbi:MAG: AbrB family transcriptional regulator [Candidatus Bathyarchaeota archaeon]|nr:AbrB family transcriptional regulator [Candidatus Bathyarchaeota archaeon]